MQQMNFYCRSYYLLNMFRAPLCPSSGTREYYTSGCCLSYLVLGFQVVGMVWSWGLCVRFAGSFCCGIGCYSTQCTLLASRLSNITIVTTGQITICSENAVWPPEDGRNDARNMLRNNWLTIKSLIVACSWSHVYLLIKDARSLEHKV